MLGGGGNFDVFPLDFDHVDGVGTRSLLIRRLQVGEEVITIDVKEVALSVALNGNSIAGKLEAVSREKKLSIVGRT